MISVGLLASAWSDFAGFLGATLGAGFGSWLSYKLQHIASANSQVGRFRSTVKTHIAHLQGLSEEDAVSADSLYRSTLLREAFFVWNEVTDDQREELDAAIERYRKLPSNITSWANNKNASSIPINDSTATFALSKTVETLKQLSATVKERSVKDRFLVWVGCSTDRW